MFSISSCGESSIVFSIIEEYTLELNDYNDPVQKHWSLPSLSYKCFDLLSDSSKEDLHEVR